MRPERLRTGLHPRGIALAQIMSKSYHNAVIEKAHDVRTLRVCVQCEGIGNSNSMLHVENIWIHGRCFIKWRGLEAFVALPRSQTDKMRLDDIGVRAMRGLLQNRS